MFFVDSIETRRFPISNGTGRCSKRSIGSILTSGRWMWTWMSFSFVARYEISHLRIDDPFLEEWFKV
jgi:hypothetical protein